MGLGIKTHLQGFRRYRYLRTPAAWARARRPEAPLLKYIGWVGHRNIGDEALFAAFRDHLFRRAFVLPYYDLSPLSVYGSFKRSRSVVLGGGTLINDDNYLVPLERGQGSGLRSYVFGTGVGDLSYWSAYDQPWRGNEDRWVRALKKASYVGVRGPRSLAWARHHGIDKAELVGDPALMLDVPPPPVPSAPRVCVGLNLGSHDPVQGGDAALRSAVLEMVDLALSSKCRVRYLAMSPIDQAIGEELRKVFTSDDFELQEFSDDVDTLMSSLVGCDYVVAQRLHVTVLACSAGIPNLSLSYQPKCLDFLESIGREDLAVQTQDISAAILIDRFRWLQRHAGDLRREIEGACEVLRGRQRQAAARVLADVCQS